MVTLAPTTMLSAGSVTVPRMVAPPICAWDAPAARTPSSSVLRMRAVMLPLSEGQGQGQMHNRLATPLRGARLGTHFAESLRVLQVDRGGRIQERPGLHEILEIPAHLEFEPFVDLDVFLRRD